jgi:hypothetical protein
VNKPSNTQRVSILLGYPEYQNAYVCSKATKQYNPFTTGPAFAKAVAHVQAAGELKSLDQVLNLLEERGRFARRNGQEHIESGPDYAVFLDTLKTGLTELDRSVRADSDPIRSAIVWSAILKALDRLHEYQWEKGVRWNAELGQVHPVLMGSVHAAGYGAYYASPSLQTLKDMLRKFDGLVDSEGYKVDRALSNTVRIVRELRADAARSSGHGKGQKRGPPPGMEDRNRK